jgi:hypothetical protein
VAVETWARIPAATLFLFFSFPPARSSSFTFFFQVCALSSFDVVILKWNASQPLVDANQEQQAMYTTQTC